MMKLVVLALLGGAGFLAWETRDDIRRYLRMRSM